MKTTKLIIIISIGTIILIGGLAACKRGYHAGGFDEFDLAAATDRIASRLDLTESQQSEFERMAAEIFDKAKSMHADRESCRRELADLVRQDAIDADEVDRRIAEKFDRMHELADFVSPRLIAFHGMLTPEQREKIAARIENHRSGGCRFGSR